MNVKNIINGWKNVIIKDHEVEDEAKRRAKICSNCEHAKHGTVLKFVKDKLKEVEGLYCGDCKCPLTAKIRSEEICKKW